MDEDGAAPDFTPTGRPDRPATDREVDAALLSARRRMRRAYARLQRTRPLEPAAELRTRAALGGVALLEQEISRLWDLELAYEDWFLQEHDAVVAPGLMYALSHLQAGIYINDLTTQVWCADGRRPRTTVLVELNAASTAVYGEILTLLRHGYPAGAEARWRTLHELSVTARLVAKRGQRIASRYLDSRFLELRQLARTGNLIPASVRRTAEAVTLVEEIEHRAAEAEATHGSELARPNGWAFPIVGKRRITFADLEAAAGVTSRRPAYAEASRRIHAGRLGTLLNLLVASDDQFFVGRQFDNFLRPALRSIWSQEEIQHLLLREVHRATKDDEPLLWSEYQTQLAAEADFEFRRGASMRLLEMGEHAASLEVLPSPAAAFALMLRDAKKPKMPPDRGLAAH